MQRLVNRRAVLAAAGVALLAGYSEGGRTDRSGRGSTDGSNEEHGLGPPTATDQLPFPMNPSSIRDRAVSGGPPKDGIPSIDVPTFVSADDAPEPLKPDDPVFGLATENEVKAYPQSLLVWHEICNDVVDGTAVSVTYCPLTGTAMGFERGDTTFGVSGRLVNNNLIMYDRATETWWPQMLATAIPGPWNEDPPIQSLKEFRVVWTTWDRWQAQYPNTRVLSRETGYVRNYDRDPYGSYNPLDGYYSPEAAPLFSTLSADDRLPPKAVVIGTRTETGTAAFEKELLRDATLIEGEVDETPIVATYDPALDTGYVFRNPNGDQFEYRNGQVVDSTGNGYSPDALPLEGVLAFDAMWFAWSGFYPDTTLYA